MIEVLSISRRLVKLIGSLCGHSVNIFTKYVSHHAESERILIVVFSRHIYKISIPNIQNFVLLFYLRIWWRYGLSPYRHGQKIRLPVLNAIPVVCIGITSYIGS